MPSLAGADVRARYLAATLDAALSKLNSTEDRAVARIMIADARRSALHLAEMLAPVADETAPDCETAQALADNVVPFPHIAASIRARP